MSIHECTTLEEKSDYSIAFMDEIFTDIRNLSKNSSSKVEFRLSNINKKIDLARAKGLNVDSLDKQILDFRFILFKRVIGNKLEEIKTSFNFHSFDISKIEEEYEKLKQEVNVEQKMDLANLIKNLEKHIVRGKLRLMIRNIKASNGNSAYTLDKILNEIKGAEEKGIEISDISDKLFE